MKYKFIYIFIIVLFFLTLDNINSLSTDNDTSDLSSDIIDTLEISIDDAVSFALKNSLDIKTEELDADQLRWAMKTNWNKFIPNISLSADMSRVNQQTEVDWYEYVGYPTFFVEDTVYQPNNMWGVGLNFNLSLSLHASMIFSIKQTVIDLEGGLISLEIAKNKVVYSTKKFFYNLILLNSNIDIMEEKVQKAEFRYKIALQNYNKGIISKYEMITAQVAFENQKPLLYDMKKAYEGAILDFRQIIGIQGNVEIVLQGELKIADYKYNIEDIINEYKKNNLEIRLLNYELKSQINNRNELISYLTPSLNFGFSMDPRFQQDPISDNWFGDIEYMKENWRQSNGSINFSISLNLSSLFPFSKDQMRIKESLKNIKKMNIQIQKNKEINIVRIKKIILQLDKSKESLRILNDNIKIAEEAYKMAEEEYRKGRRDLLVVQNAESELNLSKYNLMAEKYKYIEAIIDLQYILNSKQIK